MPVYDFKCPECGHRFEKLVKMDQEKTECPECKEEAEKTVSQPGGSGGFALKGNGWYATDFKGK